MKCPKCHFDNPSDSKFCKECGTQLLPTEEITAPTETLEIPKEELTTGSTFAGRYQIIEELGKGGMGKVYKANDTKINEKIALKLIKPEVSSDKKTIERFSNELKYARKIRHNNVCQMFDLNEERGTHYITMEYVRGEDLKRLIRKMGQLSVRQVIPIAKQVCDGLAEAHRLGVVHRDLKPQNIMVDEEGNARIMDFGIARSIAGKGITGAGVMIGTPEYMSPEQVEVKEVDQRSDIYSLGVILYEMVTGRVPFEGETPLDIAMKHKSEEPKDPKELNVQIPEDLIRLILRCMEKDKENRYQNAGEVGSELENIEKGIPTTERVIPKRKPITSREITVTFGFKKLFIPALVIISLAIIGVIIWQLLPQKEIVSLPPGKSSIAVLPFKDMSPQKDQEYFCDGMADSIINALTNIKDLQVVARTSAFSFKGKEQDVREVGKKLNVNTVLEGSVQKVDNRMRITAQLIKVADGYHLWSERFDRELEDVFAIQDEISLAIVDKLKPKLLGGEKERLVKHYTDNLEAYNLYLKGRYFWNKRTGEGLKKGMEYFQQAIEKDPTYALAYAGLADAYNMLADYGFLAPEEAFPKAKETAQKALKIDEKLAEARVSLALMKMNYDWDFKGADREFRQALEINPGYASGHHWHSFLLSRMGRHEEAIREIKRARDLDPFSPIISANVGHLLFFARKYDQALEGLERGLELFPDYWAIHGYFGMVYTMLGRYEEALTSVQRSKELAGGIPWINLGQAYIYARMGKRAEARKILDELTEASKRTYVPRAFIAAVYGVCGENDQAFAWLDKAYSEREPQYLLTLKVSPLFDPLRSDPRFQDLLRRMNFPK
jgi:serine/threonine protein kinase/tetratricopeptide (TPR) repeat protein